MTPWTVALQAPLSMEFSRQEYWNGLLKILLGIFPAQEWNLSLRLLHWQAGSLPLAPPGGARKCYSTTYPEEVK